MTNEKFKAYIAKLPIKKGKLSQWESEIFELREVGGTLLQIVEYLKTEGVNTDTSEVHRFLNGKKRLKRLGKTGTPSSTTKIETRKQTDKTVPEAPTAPETPSPASSDESKGEVRRERPGELPKFDFQEFNKKKPINW